MDIYEKRISIAPISLSTGESHTIYLTMNADVKRLEMTDMNFHHDSVVMLPGDLTASLDDVTVYSGLKSLAACFVHSNENIEQSLMIVGHTDRSGPAEYNETLSQKRAWNVFCALTGKRDAWVKSCREKHRVKDYQYILKWLSDMHYWDTDPGALDDKNGALTKAAVTRFQERYAADYGKKIDPNGSVGEETWGAFFDVYMSILEKILGIDSNELKSRQNMLTFTDPPVIGCGERYPRTSGDTNRSAMDRRVEVLFFDPGEQPDIKNGPVCSQLYSGDYYHYEPINCSLQQLKSSDKVTIQDEASVPLAHADIICRLDNNSKKVVRTDMYGNARVWGGKIDFVTVNEVHDLKAI